MKNNVFNGEYVVMNKNSNNENIKEKDLESVNAGSNQSCDIEIRRDEDYEEK